MRLASDAPSPRACPLFGSGARDLDRFPRRLVTGSGFHDPKRLQLTSAPLRARERPVGVSTDELLLPFHHPNPHEGLELDRTPAFSRNRTRMSRSERHQSESASSQKHEHDSGTSEPRAPQRLFNAVALASERLRAAKHLRTGWHLEGAVSRAGERPASMRTWRRGQLGLAEHSPVTAELCVGAWLTRRLAAQQSRFDSSRTTRMLRPSTNRERPGRRAPTQRERRVGRESHDPSPEQDSRTPFSTLENTAQR